MLENLNRLRELPIADKLRVIEVLWDDIVRSDEPFPMREWHRLEVERRLAEVEAEPTSLLTRDELWRRVDERRG